MHINRRVFLKSSGISLLGLNALPPFLQRLTLSAPSGNKKILVTVFQRGAVDGLNVVAPFGERLYYSLRPSIAIPQPSAADSKSLIDLDGFFGLHPSLRSLKPLYDQKHLAVVHAVGSPDSTRSHFDAQDFMESGTPGVKSTRDGWLNRHLHAREHEAASPFRAVALAPQLPRSLQGSEPALAIGQLAQFGVRAGQATDMMATSFEQQYSQAADSLLRPTARDAFDAVSMLKTSKLGNTTPENGAEYPRSGFGEALRQVAQLVKADLGL